MAIESPDKEEWLKYVKKAQQNDEAIKFALHQLEEANTIIEGRFKRSKNIRNRNGLLVMGNQM